MEKSGLGTAESSEGVLSEGGVVPGTERSDLGNGEMMLRGDVLLAHFIVCLQELLIRWDTCRDPGVDENLTTTDAPLHFLFLRVPRRSGAG